MYNSPIVLATSLSLGHHGVMPVVIEEGDAIIMDQQVHSSVQDAARKLQVNGIYIDILRHNQMEQLKTKIEELTPKHQKIWYLCDGVYSMYGDCAPMEELIGLANKYSNFYLYVDDAHGMSVFGENGTGYVTSKVGLHPKMVLCTGMAKAFGSVGGIFVIPDHKLCTKVRNCAGPLIFSGQQAVPLLAASIASARIHLSNEICEKQRSVAEKIHYCHHLLKKYHLPDISDPETPIFFIALGTIGLGFNMVRRLMNEGFFTNIAAFPAVSEVNTGIRFTITDHLSFNDIHKFVLALSKNFTLALNEEGRTIRDIQKAFKKINNLDTIVNYYEKKENRLKTKYDTFRIQHETSIQKINSALWDKLLGNQGSYNWNSLKLLESIFTNSSLPENNWCFHYYIVFDKENNPLLATFFTVALIKNDMLSSAAISIKVEEVRNHDHYYQTSKAMIMGALVTEGNHIYINYESSYWKEALKLLLNRVSEQQELEDAEMLLLRDFDGNDDNLSSFFLNLGFIKSAIPDTHIFDEFNWDTTEEFLAGLNHSKRQYIKQQVLRWEEHFDIEIQQGNNNKLDEWYALYQNVSKKSYEVNTFSLPLNFFKEITLNAAFETIELRLKSEYDYRDEKSAIAVMFCLKTEQRYCPLFVGIDYKFLNYNVYPQILWRTLLRAKELNLGAVNLGFTASQNKRKFGARAIPQVAYVQMRDNFNRSLLGIITNEVSYSTSKKIH